MTTTGGLLDFADCLDSTTVNASNENPCLKTNSAGPTRKLSPLINGALLMRWLPT